MKRNIRVFIIGAFVFLVIVAFVLASQPVNGNPAAIAVAPSSSGDLSTSNPLPVSMNEVPQRTMTVTGTYTGDLKRQMISRGQAEKISRDAFPQFDPDHVNVSYRNGTRYNLASFEFDFFRSGERVVQGELDPFTGSVIWYAIPIKRIGRQAQPVISIDTAQAAAENEIAGRNGVLRLNKSDARYDPLGMPESGIAGVYVFVYDRLGKTDSCNSDGFTVGVDSVTGNVIEYRKTWIEPPEEICQSLR